MITAQIESIRACWPELMEIFPVHWRELALFQDTVPLAPQRDEYFRREQEGKLFLVTMRWNGKVAGYFICQLANGFHYGKTLTATTDIYFVLPEFRNRGLFLPLYRCVEREVRRRGAEVFYCGWKTTNPLLMNEMLPKLGFIHADTYCAKLIRN